MSNEQVINKVVIVGTSPIEVFPEIAEHQEWLELSVSNQSTGGQTIRYAPTDDDLTSGGLFMAVGGFDNKEKALGNPISRKRRMAIASAANAILYVHGRMRMMPI